ncbi:MAG TPA: HEAT repeat domain-containing protein [Isosphaeraceae bacterium]
MDDYVEMARSGDLGGAFHGLRQLDASTIPVVQDAYRSEADPAVRAVLVHSIWEHRDPSAIRFLAEAVRDHDPAVWKEALDGLVSLASPEAERVLNLVICSHDDARRAWIEEAIGQIRDALTSPERWLAGPFS